MEARPPILSSCCGGRPPIVRKRAVAALRDMDRRRQSGEIVRRPSLRRRRRSHRNGGACGRACRCRRFSLGSPPLSRCCADQALCRSRLYDPKRMAERRAGKPDLRAVDADTSSVWNRSRAAASMADHSRVFALRRAKAGHRRRRLSGAYSSPAATREPSAANDAR